MLNEVFTGGLSSYSIVNMVMTHLLCMGYHLPSLPGPVGDGPGFWGSLVPAPEQPEEDVGRLLLSFFDHFGSSFNYALNAVSVGQVNGQLCKCCGTWLFACSWHGMTNGLLLAAPTATPTAPPPHPPFHMTLVTASAPIFCTHIQQELLVKCSREKIYQS